jgi:hypothetical protein
MRVKPAVFWIINIIILLANLVLWAAPQTTPARDDQIQGTFRIDPIPAPPRTYELLILDPANPAQLQAELVNRLSGRNDGRVEESWLDPNRTANMGFRMYFLVSWQR